MSDAEAVRAEWSDGDYPSVAQHLRPAAEALLAALAPLDGVELLDVATGTGNVALAAARAGADRVVGVDLTPELLEVARATAEAEGLQADFLVGDAESLEFEEDRFDVVTSTFGVIFAPRPAVAAGELARVLAPGGRLGLTAWPQGSTSALMGAAIVRHIPGANAERIVPAQWASETAIAELFAPRGVQVHVERASLDWRFPDVETLVDFVFAGVAGMRKALPVLEQLGRVDDVRADLTELYTGRARPDGAGIAVPFDYLQVTGVKTG